MRGFLKALSQEVRSFVPWTLWGAVTIAVSISGPFGSYGAFSFYERALFWTPVIGLAVAVSSIVRAYVHGGLGYHDSLKSTLISGLLNCLLLCPPLYLLISSVFPPIFAGTDQISEITLLVASMSLGICTLRYGSTPATPVQIHTAPTVLEQPRLMRRLGRETTGDIWAISVRDHYIDVQTNLGKSSLLMRFSDAIDEVGDLPGAQVHRSHWVAWAGVGSVCREGGKVIVHLKNGHQIPVSRNHRDKVDARFKPLSNAKNIAA